MARRRDGLQPRQRTPMQRNTGLAGRKIHHPQIREKHAAAKPGAQRLCTSLLGSKTLGISRRTILRPALRPRTLLHRIQPHRQPVPKPRQRFLNPPNVANVGAKAKDHAGHAPGKQGKGGVAMRAFERQEAAPLLKNLMNVFQRLSLWWGVQGGKAPLALLVPCIMP